jgi:hypothetical protein
VVRVTDIGRDTNIFNNSDGDNPKSDMTATFSPSVDGWLRMAHGRANGRTQFDLYYFKTLSDLRAVDSDSSAHFEVPINRVQPYITGSFISTRHRQNLEIDSLSRRRNTTVTLGADLRVTAKLTAGVFTRRTSLEYEANSLFLNTDLSRVLNHASTGEGVSLRYALTPLTTLGVEADRSRDRFKFASDRDSDNTIVTTNLSLNPRALISGGVSIGVQEHRVLAGGGPNFQGTIATAALSYLLLGRTRFSIVARRQLEYSFVDQTDFLNTGFGIAVAQRLGDRWDIGGSTTRDRLNYRRTGPVNPAAFSFADETVFTTTGDVSYNLGRTQVGARAEYRERQNDGTSAFRGYDRLRVGATVTYTF